VFTSVLVANRGEIACRVIGTLRRLGVRAVAAYTDVDAGARHVREADAAVALGPARAYLDVDAVVAAAVAAGADAIHPGYGFCSENPALARACAAAGIVFVGPGAEAIETMGDKVAAKRLVAKHDVPVLPGTLDAALDDDALVAAAADVGFPLLVKPVAGGGGKGMVVVHDAGALPDALASARRVAASVFGDDGLLLEHLVTRARHVEVQVLADAHGVVVHLGERECSLQRRHQKIVEEAPSPLVDVALRERMGAAACEVARAVGYTGVGTVELLVPADAPADFAFIEMNTRLQVEHPVTEMVTGIDLVEAQLRVAAGEPLWFAQEDVRVRGHAVEARVYAESPARGFLPSAGRVLAFDDGGAGAGPTASPVRLDAGIATGDVVTGDYDPMLAKAVAHGDDRAQALARLDGLLSRVSVLGVETNTGFLRDLLADGDVRSGRLDTGLVDRFVARSPELSGRGEGLPAPRADSSMAMIAAALLAGAPECRGGDDDGGGMPSDPWAADGWRPGLPAAPRRVSLRAVGGDVLDLVLCDVDTSDAVRAATVVPDGGSPVRATLRPVGGPAPRGAAQRWLLSVAPYPPELSGGGSGIPVPGPDSSVVGELSGGGSGIPVPGPDSSVGARAGAGTTAVLAARDGDTLWLGADGRTTSYTVLDRPARAALRRAARRITDVTSAGTSGTAAGPVEVRAQMPGTVVATPQRDGRAVAVGAAVVVVEAMKMEHPLLAPTAGILRLAVHPGDQVRLDQVVAVVEPEGAP
jgi:acetyl-CoA/propionyl-CoA carboxylase biotin carboxyl carrier protein